MSVSLMLCEIMVVLFRSSWTKPVSVAIEGSVVYKFSVMTQVLDYLQRLIYVPSSNDGSYSVERLSEWILVIHSGEHNYRIEATPICIIVSDGAGEEVEI